MIVIVVAIAAAFQVRSVQGFGANDQVQGFGANDQMTVTSLNMPMQGQCDGCAGNEKSMAPSACSPFCSTLAAFIHLGVTYDPVFSEIVSATADTTVAGRTTPPDPYPPRPTRMS